MAIYRNISMAFWTDTKISDDFSPEDKYFMLYCLTNPYTNLCGCYEISIKQMSRDTGYNTETIEKLIQRFNDNYNMIKYNLENKELLVLNWSKYNWTKSQKLNKPLLEEIKRVKTAEYKQILAELYNSRDTVSIPYIYPSDTTVSVTVSDTVSDINKIEFEKILKELINFYNNNIGAITPYGAEVLTDFAKEMDKELIILAMKKAVEANIRTIQYIKGILNSWSKKGIKTIIEAQKEDETFKNKKDDQQKKTTYNNYEQRQYNNLDNLYTNLNQGE